MRNNDRVDAKRRIVQQTSRGMRTFDSCVDQDEIVVRFELIEERRHTLLRFRSDELGR